MQSTIEQNGWKVARRIGVGDRENVRAGLIQVGCLIDDQIIEQVESCFKFAKHIDKTLRFYINAFSLRLKNKEALRFIQHNIMTTHRDHDLMEEEDLDNRLRFDWVLGRCDFLIYPQGGSQEDLVRILNELWDNSNGRGILRGHIGDPPQEKLREIYPQFFGGEDELFERINKL